MNYSQSEVLDPIIKFSDLFTLRKDLKFFRRIPPTSKLERDVMRSLTVLMIKLNLPKSSPK